MTGSTHSRWRALWLIPPLLIGVMFLLFMAGGKKPPQKAQQSEPTRAVRVILVPQVDFIPKAEGYGTVQPAQIWQAVAQVSGRITRMHPRLRDGEILAADTELFRIDPVDYELAVAQAQAQLAELDVQEANATASLAIEQRNQSIAQRELDRVSKLATKGTASQSNVDEAERALLNGRAAVQNLRNSLALIPTQRRLAQARLTQAERDLANTIVRAPFNLRVANLAMETDQYVSKGQTLLQGDSVDRVEVVAQIAMSSLRNLFIGRPDSIRSIEQLNANLASFTGFRPLLRLDLGNHTAQWEAEFVRFSDAIDSETRTMGLVVAVDDPLGKIRVGLRPPLSKGMFLQVVLSGHPQPGRLVLPRSALHAGRVYLVDAQNRLRIRPVEVLFNQGQLSVIKQGLQGGEQLVVSDLIPAIDGMLLQTTPDEALQAEINRTAGGGA